MNTNDKVIGLTRLGIEPQVYRSRSRRSVPLGHLIGSVQLSNLISRNFYYDTMQQYRYFNFSDVFCLNYIFVIDAAVKQLVSGSSLKYEVSAVTMAAHKILKKKSNLHCNRFIKLAVALQRRSEWRGPTPRLNAWTTQLRRNVAAVASRWLLCVRFDRPGN